MEDTHEIKTQPVSSVSSVPFVVKKSLRALCFETHPAAAMSA